MKQHRIEGDVAYFDRAWGTLKMDVQDLHLLDGWQIKGKTTKQKHKAYVQVSIRKEPHNGKRECFVLSRIIVNCPDEMEVDHINHDATDNRRCNLRICTRQQNRRNNRGNRQCMFKGVVYAQAKKYNPNASEAKPWRAITKLNQKRVSLGYYETQIEAAMAYNAYVAKEFKEFACFNRFDACPVINLMKTTQHDKTQTQLLLL